MAKVHSPRSAELNDFEALDLISEAEAKAKLILDLANQKKHALVEKAKKDSVFAVAEAEKKALEERENQLASLKKALEKEKEKLAAQNEKMIAELKQKAQLNSKKEAEFLVRQFLSEVLNA